MYIPKHYFKPEHKTDSSDFLHPEFFLGCDTSMQDILTTYVDILLLVLVTVMWGSLKIFKIFLMICKALVVDYQGG